MSPERLPEQRSVEGVPPVESPTAARRLDAGGSVEPSGVAAVGHGADCGCTRCTGFQKGHGLSVRHGAYGVLRLRPRAMEIAGELREVVPGYRHIDEAAVRTLAIVLAQIEAAEAALASVDAMTTNEISLYAEGPADRLRLQRLREDMRGWINTARRLYDDLGLTPRARARLGLDVAMARRVADDVMTIPATDAEADAIAEAEESS